MPWTKWKSDINQAITSVCIQIIKEPLIYFSEADIQQLLVEELRKINSISKPYLTSVRKGKNSKGKYKTSLIHREYGGGNRTRIDIVIFDPSLSNGGHYRYFNWHIAKLLDESGIEIIFADYAGYFKRWYKDLSLKRASSMRHRVIYH